MESQRETFVMHAEYIEDLPEEAKAQFLMYVYNYGIKGIVPELTGFEKTAWIKIQRRIDADIGTYEKKCANLKQNRNKSPKTPDTDNELSDTEKAISDTENEKSDSDIEFVNEFDNEIEIESDYNSDAPKVPVKESPPLQAYAQKVFEIFKNAGLPCARSNFISFLQRDFKNGMAYIRKNIGNLHSDDVIGACENYAKTVQDPRSYITGKYSFERLVQFKNFIDYLPANYQAENFIDRKATGGTPPPQAKKWQQECPDCKAKALEYSNKLEKYVCNNCGKVYTYEQIPGG